MMIFRQIIIALIVLYQRYISPYKGFRCAYGQLYKNGTCSSRISEIVRTVPFKNMRIEISTQFKMCAAANKTLEDDRPKYPLKPNRKETDECNDQLWCAACNCPSIF